MLTIFDVGESLPAALPNNLSSTTRGRSILFQVTPPTGEPDAGNPPVRFGGRGSRTQSVLPTPIHRRSLCDQGSVRPSHERSVSGIVDFRARVNTSRQLPSVCQGRRLLNVCQRRRIATTQFAAERHSTVAVGFNPRIGMPPLRVVAERRLMVHRDGRISRSS